ncbi:Hsp20/alpha crystallin family protein [Thermovirga sp.]|uniref:Hsp20/alpha crystallin family protein n=1 Tax=Thermovirga sp. TaxID=2699834 RepID=UPI0025E412D4|nr:Hsp20/alpha crystallin family protein [Thermovirga sp.]MBO8154068.1 Hsp20/alpha crystallin family protein [Thermovirga sp.]
MTGRYMMPWNGTRSIFDEMDEFFRGFSEALRPMTSRYAPVEMYEEGNELVLKVDAPGFEPSDVEIKTFADKVLIQSKVEQKEEKEEKGKTYYIRRRSQAMNYSINLPYEVDPAKAKASFKNGVITIKLPKSEAVEGRVIPIEKE